MEMSVLWGSLRRRWYLVLALAVLTLGAMFVVTQRVGPTYEATGTVLVYPPVAELGCPTGPARRRTPTSRWAASTRPGTSWCGR